MNMMKYINEFVDTMINEKSQFENIQNEVSKREKDVENVIDSLRKNEEEIINDLQNRVSQSKDSNIRSIFAQTSQNMFETMNEVNLKIKEAVNGMEFIHEFENHFTVSVFGKVKAGKSYIGNFIMGNTLKECEIQSSYDKLETLKVHVYDRGKTTEQNELSTLEEENESFGVDMKEATSTIQWFDIGGMSWFDTPGIGSITWENEMLAKEYVKNSDLVIFACNSDAAGTRQEFSEIKKLHEMGKPILLLLTQSDTCDYDVDDNGEEISILIPKSDKDREDTEKYMLETLREQGMEDVLKYADILTVSAKLANEALKNSDELLFEHSNMGSLLDKLTQITKNEAATMKKNTPKNRINEMIDSIITDLNNVSQQINETCSIIENNKNELIERKDWMLEQIKASVNLKIMEIIARNKTKVEKNLEVISEQQISDEINEAIICAIKKVCEEEAISKTEKIPDLNIKLTGIGDMKMKQERIPYEYVSVIQKNRPPKGFLEKIGATVLKKEYYTYCSETRIRYSEFDIGVNDSEIAQNIVLQLSEVFSTTVNEYIDNLVKGYYEPVEVLQRKTIGAIKNAGEQLGKLRM